MKWKSIGAGLCFVLAMVIFGFFLGGFLGSRVFGGTGMGWDRLADALGGMFLGIAGGLVVGLLLVKRLSIAQRMWASAGLMMGAAFVLLLLRFIPHEPYDGTSLLAPPPALVSTMPSESTGTRSISPQSRLKYNVRPSGVTNGVYS